MLDPEERITSWNVDAERITGFGVDEVNGTHVSRVYMEEDRDAGEPEKALKTARSEGRFEKEAWHVRKNRSRP